MPEHDPNDNEQALIDELLENFEFDFVPVRLTETMLSKSIMDARAPLRVRLGQNGIVEYDAIGQGNENRVRASFPFIWAEGVESRTVSFYRPLTKQGDPRVWVGRLNQQASANDLLLFCFAGTEMCCILLRGDPEQLLERAATVLPSRTAEREEEWERVVRRIVESLKPHTDRWIKTHRSGPTGVGYTLETILGIQANTSRLADVDGVELKAFRRVATGKKLITLFSKTPDWMTPARGDDILRRCGYYDERRKREALYCTIVRNRNQQGLRLNVDASARRVGVVHESDLVMTYTMATLEGRLREKHAVTLFVTAESRGAGASEEFRYSQIVLHRNPSLANFLDLIDVEEIGLDLTLHRKPNGRVRDHGYLWRISERSLGRLFAYRKSILS